MINKNIKKITGLFFQTAIIIFLLAACAHEPPKIQMNVHASSNLNPDINGNTSPIVLTIYELRSQTKFNDADFSALDDAGRALGHQLVDQNAIEIAPASHHTQVIKISAGTRYLGITAAFRALGQSTWKAIIAIPKETGHLRLLITLANNHLSVQKIN